MLSMKSTTNLKTKASEGANKKKKKTSKSPSLCLNLELMGNKEDIQEREKENKRQKKRNSKRNAKKADTRLDSNASTFSEKEEEAATCRSASKRLTKKRRSITQDCGKENDGSEQIEREEVNTNEQIDILSSSNVCVVCRVRPFNRKEINLNT
jgi:hypothetical protein